MNPDLVNHLTGYFCFLYCNKRQYWENIFTHRTCTDSILKVPEKLILTVVAILMVLLLDRRLEIYFIQICIEHYKKVTIIVLNPMEQICKISSNTHFYTLPTLAMKLYTNFQLIIFK